MHPLGSRGSRECPSYPARCRFGVRLQPPSLKMGCRPTKRAIRMANALVLEQKLHAGESRSLTDVCDTFGITRMVLSKTLDMLDHPPEEISAILRKTY